MVAVAALARSGRADVEKGPYLQAVTPAAITVMWEASPAMAGRVTVEGPGLPSGGKTVEVSPAEIERAVIDGLAPASRYRYVVEIGATRETGEFATAPAKGSAAPLAFAVIGDNGVEQEVHRRLIDRVLDDAPEFIISTGDLVGDAGSLHQWTSFFAVDHDLLRDRVLFPAFGNHDVKTSDGPIDVLRWFTLPDAEPSQQYYAFSYGRSRFVVLNSNERGVALDDETAWLEHTLADARADTDVDHVFVVMHHPLFSIGHHGGKILLRQRWAPVLERFHVTAVFAGHDHVYERARAGGVRYFVSGGGGASLYQHAEHADSQRDAAAVQRFAAVHHYLRVEVDGERVAVTAVRPDGTVIETTEWSEPTRATPSLPAPPANPPAVELLANVAPTPVAGAIDDPLQDRGVVPVAIAGAIALLLAISLLAFNVRRHRA